MPVENARVENTPEETSVGLNVSTLEPNDQGRMKVWQFGQQPGAPGQEGQPNVAFEFPQ
jgi:hypothetical protein